MKQSAIFRAAALAALLLSGQTLVLADKASDEKALRDIEVRWNKEFAAKDVDKLVAHYADDAMVMATGTPPASGSAAIRKMLQDMVADPAFSLKFDAKTIEVSKSGDLAYTHGTYTMTMTDPGTKKRITDHGHYVTTYRKMPDGSWKAVHDIASSEVPPTPAPRDMKNMKM
jgi:uncharacterized protein (TIGR02246 family)